VTIWHVLEPNAVVDWVSDLQAHQDLPQSYTFPTPAEQVERAISAVTQLGIAADVSRRSSAVRITTQETPVEFLVDQGLQLAFALDTRNWFQWDDLSEEEQPSPHVATELVSSVDGLHCLGPGGRITVSHFQDGQTLLDVVVRPRVEVVNSTWRAPSRIVDGVGIMLFNIPEDARLRAALGYREASGYETQELLRPYFVFLLDRPHSDEGPGWRVAAEISATSVDDDDNGPGDFTNVDDSGCV
jgi:hypothetical protein